MANWVGTARTNYFKVKDVEAFLAEMEHYDGIEVWPFVQDADMFAIGFEDGSYPDYRILDLYEKGDVDANEEVDFLEEVSKHLQENSILIYMTAGAEKMRYVTGEAEAVNCKNERERISLNDIYAQAQEAFGDAAEITVAEY